MSFVYLAAPYSHANPVIEERRFLVINHVAAQLIESGECVFSPISHSHLLNQDSRVKITHEQWLRQDMSILQHADRLLVLDLPGWHRSVGVTLEIEAARAIGIEVEHLSPSDWDIPKLSIAILNEQAALDGDPEI